VDPLDLHFTVMKKLFLALVALICISSDLSSQTITRKGGSTKSQKISSPGRRTVYIGKPPPGAVLSPAIVSGNLVFTSGQIGIDPKTSQMVEGGFEAQAEQVLRNLAAVLEAAGSDMSQVLKTTVFLADMENYNKMNEIYRRHFKEEPPARSTVQVARLPRNAMIEIEAVALVKK
jgi:2-iminobutanoate/2-iminopropanoate deaminase